MTSRTRRWRHGWRRRRKWAHAARFYRGLIPPNQLCFDVGANVGDLSILLARLGHRVVSLEPQSACLGDLHRRLRHEPAARVIALGVSDREGTADLHLGSTTEVSTLSTSFMEAYESSDVHWAASERIQLTTLERLIEEHGRPWFCKIDVEGHELQVLRGLAQTIPLIQFEFNRRLLDQAAACVERLEQLGSYTFDYSPFERFRLALPRALSADEFIETLEATPDSLLTGDVFARLRATSDPSR